MADLYSLKIIKTESFKTVLVCDAELLGKKFTESKGVLDISEEYYGGEIVEEEAVMTELINADYISLVGERSVNLGVKSGMIHPEAVTRISGIPYAIFVNTLF
ncbi:MAG: DUF424 domain-containing protein [Fervidicoccaceae archaeon]|jgi:hypothetical protein